MKTTLAESLLWATLSLCIVFIVVSGSMAGNTGLVSTSDVVRPLAVLGAGATLVTLGLMALLPPLGRVFPVVLYSYFVFFNIPASILTPAHLTVLGCLMTVAAPLALHLILRRCNSVRAAAYGVAVAAVVATATLATMTPSLFYAPLHPVVRDFHDDTLALRRRDGNSRLPDIIYVVPDRYPNAATLRREFAMDNEPFYDALRTRGFTVAPNAHANYPRTFQSLASTLNGGYLDRFTAAYGTDSGERRPVFDAIEDNVVQARLRRLGYRFHHHGAWWEPTRVNRWADVNDPGFDFLSRLSEFERAIINRTPTWDVAALFTGRQDTSECRRIQRQMLRLETAGNGPEPVFVFAHVFVPHDPVTMDAAGRCLDRPLFYTTMGRWGPDNYQALHDWDDYRAAFADYVRYFNAAVLQIIDRQLESRQPGGRQLIFAIQSDEGPLPRTLLESGDYDAFGTLTQREIRMKLGTINALRLPSDTTLDPAFLATPVNNWRIIFNTLTDTTLRLLPHRIHLYPSARQLYRFCDATAFVTGKDVSSPHRCPQ